MSRPTVRRRIVGAQLRRLREAAGTSRKEAAEAINATESRIGRLEQGRAGLDEDDVVALLKLYGIDDRGERDALLTVVREASRPGWLQAYNNAMPAWFRPYVDLEEAAQVIRTYEVQFIPGLLQTPEYTRAVVMQGMSDPSADEVERRVELRMRRQRILYQPHPPRLWAVIDEAALWRPIGGVEVTRAQLRALHEAARRENITVQVMPFRVGGHAGEAGAFTILRFPEPELPDIAYIEQLTGAMYLEKDDDMDHYTAAMERLCVQSASPEESMDLISKIMREL
ncbi:MULTISPECIES: helix-turn-helix domain-containing protein [Actinoallomurus]|uniref:helix-turn-helix domain-containing protein n=1 Tax=Actinoallomurus TaxID=667113 RepID=UPI002092573C|nr:MULTISPECIES: helix-turn-helix transcriptional regulator [Actinoallomurus]MCO5966979.1 helix-turn-helix domain-containing protein [Actinoallomurus soli]MCO5996393.1 helix-turn-helix domain-containing protein [Actinoallomurus rhizosphaericola]